MTRCCAQRAGTRSCWTRPGRGSRSATTPNESCATARWPSPTRPRPSAWGPAAADGPAIAGRSTRRWRPAAPAIPGRRPEESPLMELATNYMGLELRNPLVASASPLSHTVDGVRRLADAGVGAVVLHSLFEEQLREEAELDARLPTPAPRASPSRCPISPRRPTRFRPTPPSEPGGARSAAVEVPVIAEPQRRHVRRAGPTTRARCRTPAPPRSS